MVDYNAILKQAQSAVSGLLGQKAQDAGTLSVDTSGSPSTVSASDVAGSATSAEASKKSALDQMMENLQKLGTGKPQAPPPMQRINISAVGARPQPNVRSNSPKKPTLSDTVDYLSSSTDSSKIIPPYTPPGQTNG